MINKNKKRRKNEFPTEFSEHLSERLGNIYNRTDVPASVSADILKAKTKYALNEKKQKNSFRRYAPAFAMLLFTIVVFPVATVFLKAVDSDNVYGETDGKYVSNASSHPAQIMMCSDITASRIVENGSLGNHEYLRRLIAASQLKAGSDAKYSEHESYDMEQPMKLENNFTAPESARESSDILREDEKFFYYIKNDSQQTLEQKLLIIDKVSAEIISSVSLEAGTYNEMYLYDNKLAVISNNNDDYISVNSGDTKYKRLFSDEDSTTITVYDVADVKNPKKLRAFSQQGESVTTKIIDGKIVMISKRKITADVSGENAEKENFLPFTYDSLDDSISPINDISVCRTDKLDTYFAISEIDLNDLTSPVFSKAFLGDVSDFFIGEDNVYLAYADHDLKTVVESLSLQSRSTESASLEINLADDLFFNEKDGKLYVSGYRKTSYGYDGELCVFDIETLAPYSKISVPMSGELTWVNYLNDAVYWLPKGGISSVIVIDTSRPDEMTVAKRMPLSGSMEYIYNLSDELMLGIGYSNNDNYDSKITLSLFDVSDIYNPEFINGVALGNQQSFSDMYYDFRSLRTYKYNDFLLTGCPINLFTASSNELMFDENFDFCGIYLFTATEERLQNIIALAHTDENGNAHQIYRWSVVDDKIYTFSDHKMMVNSVQNGKRVGEVIF